MVGNMLACALATASKHNCQPLSVCVVEGNPPRDFAVGSNPAYDIRVSALSVASQTMMQHVGAWEGIVQRRACPYKRLSVWDELKKGRTDFNAADIQAPCLGHIVENSVIQLALYERLQQLNTVELICPDKLDNYHVNQDDVTLSLASGKQLSAQLLVGADGAQSRVRQLAGIEFAQQRYDQYALVASIETELTQQDITWQAFAENGPLAFLPLQGSRASIVWYEKEAVVRNLNNLPEVDFIKALEHTFPQELGAVTAVRERAFFPISKAHTARYVQNRIALVGDAAHTVHPLAGQGVNLGLLDAAALSDVLFNAVINKRNFSNRKILRRYERWRRAENQLMISALDNIYRVFHQQPDIVASARSTGLNMVDSINPLRHFIMRHAMGIVGDLPLLAKP